MIRLCVFDMDGLLLDSERQMYCKVGLEVSAEIGRPVSEHFLTTLMGLSWDNYPKGFLREYGEDYPIDEYLERYWQKVHYIVDNIALPLRPGVKEMLEYCRSHQIKMAIATSSHQNETKKCLTNAGIYDYFDYIITGDDVLHGKPDPEIFLRAIAHFQIPKNEALVFEDGHNGARAAINGECRLVLVEDLAYLDDDDRRRAELHTDKITDAIKIIEKENA